MNAGRVAGQNVRCVAKHYNHDFVNDKFIDSKTGRGK
jgi:hypothetical protein